jgi:hypothetical protein
VLGARAAALLAFVAKQRSRLLFELSVHQTGLSKSRWRASHSSICFSASSLPMP